MQTTPLSKESLGIPPLSREALDYLYKQIHEYISRIETAQRDFQRYWGLLEAAIYIYNAETGKELPEELRGRVLALTPGRARGRRKAR